LGGREKQVSVLSPALARAQQEVRQAAGDLTDHAAIAEHDRRLGDAASRFREAAPPRSDSSYRQLILTP
jgi:hypothetical protein